MHHHTRGAGGDAVVAQHATRGVVRGADQLRDRIIELDLRPCLHGEGGGVRGGDQDRRDRNGGTDAPKPAAEGSAKVEHPEMEAGRSLHEHMPRSAHPARESGAWTREARMKSVSNSIASNSRGPAVLFTMICSFASSASISARGMR